VALRWITLAIAAALIAPAALVLLLPNRSRPGAGVDGAPEALRREPGRLDLLWSVLPAAFLVVLIALAAGAAA
jgi:hypothetical protein